MNGKSGIMKGGRTRKEDIEKYNQERTGKEQEKKKENK